MPATRNSIAARNAERDEMSHVLLPSIYLKLRSTLGLVKVR
jgi:hypothetical protein